MADTDPKPLTDDAFCIGCSYSLRGLGSPRCPECGREFDPKDSATMSPDGRCGYASERCSGRRVGP